jgi:hypothetical protein
VGGIPRSPASQSPTGLNPAPKENKMTEQDRSWLAPGQKVAIRSFGGWHESWSLATVERHTTTQIVTDNGRFRLDTLREVGGGRGELRPTTDPGLRDELARRLISNLRHEIDQLIGRGPRSAVEILECAEVIEGKVAEAKAAITKYARA